MIVIGPQTGVEYGFSIFDVGSTTDDIPWNISTKFGNLRIFRDGTKALYIHRSNIFVPQTGGSANPAIQIGSNGVGFYVNSSGEVVVNDEAGNSMPISELHSESAVKGL
jgi:hypothetical protein